MSRRDVVLVIGLACAVSLLGGLLFGIGAGRIWSEAFVPRTATPSPSPTPAPTPTLNRVSILFLGVDSRINPQPKLELCWVLTFEPGTHAYFLAGFSPATPVQLSPADPVQTLQEIYANDQYLQTGQSRFTRKAVQIISPGIVLPQAEIVFDREIAAEAINLLGGIQIEGQTLDGPTLLAFYDFNVSDDAGARLAFQGTAVEAIASAAQQKNWSEPAVQALVGLVQKWNPDAAYLQSLAEAELPLTDAQFSIVVAPLAGPATPQP